MAAENVYADVTSTSYVSGTYDEIGTEYKQPLIDLLPPGWCWIFSATSNMIELLQGISYTFKRMGKRAEDLFEEVDPRTMFELLSLWEDFLDLPGDNPNPASTLAERRSAVLAKFLGNSDPNIEFFEDLANSYNFDPAVVVSNPAFSVFVAGDWVGKPLNSIDWAYTFLISVFPNPDDSDIDDSEGLEWELDNYTPAHTEGYVNYLTLDGKATPTTDHMYGVAYNGSDLWVAVGANTGADSEIIISIDGDTWTAEANPKDFRLTGVLYDSLYDVWVAVGYADGVDAYIVTSPDGVTWTERANPKNFSLNAVVTNELGTIVAVGAADGTDAYIITSTDAGATWSEQSNDNNTALYCVRYADDLFVAGGASAYLVTSPDGTTWTTQTASFMTTIYGVTYSSSLDLWVVVGLSGKIGTSSDGATWIERTGPASTTLYAVAWSDATETFIATGATGYVITSTDGITWTQRSVLRTSIDLYGIGTDNEYKYICVGESETWWDGVFKIDFGARILRRRCTSWAEQTNPKNFALNDVTCRNIYYYIAVGEADGADAYMVYSLASDGETWTELANPKNFALNAITHNGGTTFVAVGDADGADAYTVYGNCATLSIAESSNPKNFNLYGVAYSSSLNLFVAVGEADGADAYLVTSTDGTTWTEQSSTTTQNLNGVAYDSNNARWVAVGASDGTNAAILISDNDGADWTAVEPTVDKDYDLYKVYHWNNPMRPDDNLWIAIGESDGSDAYCLTSSDGETWTEQGNDKAFAINGLASNGVGQIIGVGAADGVDAYLIKSEN